MTKWTLVRIPPSTDVEIEYSSSGSEPDSPHPRASHQRSDQTQVDHHSMTELFDSIHLTPTQSLESTVKAGLESNNPLVVGAASIPKTPLPTQPPLAPKEHKSTVEDFVALQTDLLYLLHASRHGEVRARLHRATLQTQFERRTFDLAALSSWLGRCLGEVCAPQRDGMVRDGVEYGKVRVVDQKTNMDGQGVRLCCQNWKMILDTLIDDIVAYKQRQSLISGY